MSRETWIGYLQAVLVLSLLILFLWQMRPHEAGTGGLTARIQPSTCVGWMSSKGKVTDRGLGWPNWADLDLEITAGSISAVAWGRTNKPRAIVRFASFLNPVSAKEWNLKGAQPFFGSGAEFRQLQIESSARFSLRLMWHDYGSLSFTQGGLTWASFGLAEDADKTSPIMYVEVLGTSNSGFTLTHDETQRTGVFGDAPKYRYLSFPPMYPEGVVERTWSGALAPRDLSDANDECAQRVAPQQTVGMNIMVTPMPTSPLQESAQIRLTRAVQRIAVSGTTGTLSVDGLERTIGPEDWVDVSSDLAQLTLDTETRDLAFHGKLASVTVNRRDVRPRRIESWAWYWQAAFWSVLAWAAAGAWNQRRELLLQATHLRRRWQLRSQRGDDSRGS